MQFSLRNPIYIYICFVFFYIHKYIMLSTHTHTHTTQRTQKPTKIYAHTYNPTTTTNRARQFVRLRSF